MRGEIAIYAQMYLNVHRDYYLCAEIAKYAQR